MDRLVGVLGPITLTALLAACGGTVNQTPPGVPQARLAPATAISGTIPAEAGHHGVLFGGMTVVVGVDDSWFEFAASVLRVEFNEDGQFSAVLPMTAGTPLPYENCDFVGHSQLSMLYTSTLPIGDRLDSEDLVGEYLLESTTGPVLLWYSPADAHVTCTTSERGNMSGGGLEDWDLRLKAGWNYVLAVRTPAVLYLRTGIPAEATWVPFPDR